MTAVDEVIQNLPRHERLIVSRLRELVRDTLPHAVEKISYGVPFYTGNRMICFIWPPSVAWSAKQKVQEKGVTLGFCQGNKFGNEDQALLKEGRKQVYCMYFQTLDQVHDDQIKALLFEAEMIDESFRKPRKNRRA